MKIKSIKNFNNIKPYTYYHHRVWTSMNRKALKKIEKLDKANNYKFKNIIKLFKEREKLYKIDCNNIRINQINKLMEIIREKRFRKMYYNSHLIRKYNIRNKLSQFGKRVKTRYNKFNVNWRIVYE